MGTPGPAEAPSATVPRVHVPTGGGIGYGRFGRPERGGDRLDAVIGRGTLLAGRYRLHQPVADDLPDAQTWTARDQILDRPVRALILTGANSGPAQDAARRAALVSDPRLLRVLDVGDHEGVAYVVTEPVVGQDLGRLTANGPLPADQARAIVGEAAAALEVARRRGVHHLALRPGAVHVTPDGAVLVTGLAVDGELFGNARGDAKSTSRADTVGLVAVLYLGLTGRWPAASGAAGTPGTAAGGDAGTPVAPSVSGSPVPPAELSPAVPADLDTLCAVTLGPHDDGPHSPGELVRELEPWPAIDAAAVYDSLDAATRSAVVPGPWDGGGTDGPAKPGSTSGAPTSGAPTSGAPTSGAPASEGPGAGAGFAPPAAARVLRQSVRQSATPPSTPAGASAGSSAGAVPASARPPVLPPPVRPPVRPPVQPPSVQPPPVQPPSVRPAAVRPTSRASHDAGFDELLSEPVSLVRRRFNATPVVLGLIGLLLVFGIVWAWQAFTAPAPPIGGDGGLSLTEQTPGTGGDESTEPEPEASPTAPVDDGAAPGVAPVIASAQMLDPPPDGDNNEHPEAVPLAIDGDATTFWFTRTYASPSYGMKQGVGYAVTLAEPATVTTVRLQVNGTGGKVEVRATDPATPTTGDVLASGALSPDTVLTLETPTEAQHIVLWFTELPQTPDGRNRIELLELQVS
jgi:hypothetical protein